MFKRVLCTGECNIRVDLLILYPVLAVATLLLPGSIAWRAFKGRRGSTGG